MIDVCYYAKIRILKQITTSPKVTKFPIWDVCYYAKIRILKQITTLMQMKLKIKWCLLLCKDKNFKANHNIVLSSELVMLDVCYYAKIRILKQITTSYFWFCGRIRCLLLCKDKNFKANHNLLSCLCLSMLDVCYYAKIRILKQITTNNGH